MSTPLPGTGALGALTVFVNDLGAEAAFCHDVLGLAAASGGEESVQFMLGSTCLNLLAAEHAEQLVTPAAAAAVDATAQVMLTLWVDDVDGVCAQVQQRGATVLNGPVDRPWGKRTAAFASPAGLVWEVAQDI